jgi:hypothetical protein
VPISTFCINYSSFRASGQDKNAILWLKQATKNVFSVKIGLNWYLKTPVFTGVFVVLVFFSPTL